MINYFLIFTKEKLREVKGEFGVSVIINTAIALIVTAFILFPSVRSLASTMTSDMSEWYTNTIKTVLLPPK